MCKQASSSSFFSLFSSSCLWYHHHPHQCTSIITIVIIISMFPNLLPILDIAGVLVGSGYLLAFRGHPPGAGIRGQTLKTSKESLVLRKIVPLDFLFPPASLWQELGITDRQIQSNVQYHIERKILIQSV